MTDYTLKQNEYIDESIPVWAHDDNDTSWAGDEMPKVVLNKDDLKLFSDAVDEKQRLSTEIQRHQRCIVALRSELATLDNNKLAEKFEVDESYITYKQYEFGYRKPAKVVV